MSHSTYLHKALALAEKAESRNEVPVGAIVVHDGKVIGEGYNLRESDQDPLAHAELRAIAGAARALKSWRLIDCDLYVTLEPCPMCLAACQQARVRKVVYGAKDEKGGAICLGFHIHTDTRTNHRFEVEYAPMDECSEILKKFFLRRRGEQKSAKLKS